MTIIFSRMIYNCKIKKVRKSQFFTLVFKFDIFSTTDRTHAGAVIRDYSP